jgi:tetratricopeptide (TPR) repeat protein
MPASPQVWYGLQRSYDALTGETADRLAQLAPNSAEALALSAELAFEHGNAALAFQRYRQALALRSSFRGIHERVAEIYEATGHADWASVERSKTGAEQEVAKPHEETPEALYWRAQELLALARQANARLQQLPPSKEQFEAAARAAEDKGRYPEAATAWQQALKADPGDGSLKRRLALALCHGNDCVSALPLLKEELAKEAGSAELNYLCGLALNSTRDPGRALPYLEAAVRLDPKFVPARGALGEAYLEAGQPARAITELKAAIAEDETGSWHYQLARAYQAAGMREQSLAVLRDYREILRKHGAEHAAEPAITAPAP